MNQKTKIQLSQKISAVGSNFEKIELGYIYLTF